MTDDEIEAAAPAIIDDEVKAEAAVTHVDFNEDDYPF